jgi:hypothetical protein
VTHRAALVHAEPGSVCLRAVTGAGWDNVDYECAYRVWGDAIVAAVTLQPPAGQVGTWGRPCGRAGGAGVVWAVCAGRPTPGWLGARARQHCGLAQPPGGTRARSASMGAVVAQPAAGSQEPAAGSRQWSSWQVRSGPPPWAVPLELQPAGQGRALELRVTRPPLTRCPAPGMPSTSPLLRLLGARLALRLLPWTPSAAKPGRFRCASRAPLPAWPTAQRRDGPTAPLG